MSSFFYPHEAYYFLFLLSPINKTLCIHCIWWMALIWESIGSKHRFEPFLGLELGPDERRAHENTFFQEFNRFSLSQIPLVTYHKYLQSKKRRKLNLRNVYFLLSIPETGWHSIRLLDS